LSRGTQAGGMDRQTLRDWVHRYNAEGLEGLADQPRSGRPARLNPDQLAEVVKWVEDGPDLKTDGVVRWRCIDLGERIAARFEVELHERTVGKLLKKLGFSSISARPSNSQAPPEVSPICRSAARSFGFGRNWVAFGRDF
jgi:transposase